MGSGGSQGVDVPLPSPPKQAAVQPGAAATATAAGPVNRKVQRQIRKLGVGDSSRSGGGTLFTERVLIVNQKAKLFEKKAEYAVFDQHGRKIGGVREFGLSMSSFVVGRENATKRLLIVDGEGSPLLTLTRPATMWKSKVAVMRGDGSLVGHIAQESLGVMASMLGGKFNVRFRMEADGKTIGSINAEDWRAWDFNLLDENGAEVARITKTWAGLGREKIH